MGRRLGKEVRQVPPSAGHDALRVTNVLFDDRYGGPSKRVTQVAQRLIKRGVRTTVCLPAGNGNAADVARAAGVAVLQVPFGRTPRPRDLLQVAHWLFQLPRDILRFVRLFREQETDVVHVNGAFFVAPAVAAKLARVPLVWHLNDTILPKRIAPLFGSMVALLANRVIVAAEAVARHYAVPDGLYAIVHAPVDAESFRAIEKKEDGQRVRIGLIANWNPLKGLEHFVRAMALVRQLLGGEIEVVIAGAKLETHADYARRVEALIEKLGLRPVVRDCGFVNPVAPVLADLDVLVLSSTTEASPMAVLEGMAAGVPVVATDVGGVREILLGGPSGPAGVVVPPRAPEALAAGVLAVISDPEEARRMGRNGRMLAETRFSLEACVDRHLNVYKSLVTRSEDY